MLYNSASVPTLVRWPPGGKCNRMHKANWDGFFIFPTHVIPTHFLRIGIEMIVRPNIKQVRDFDIDYMADETGDNKSVQLSVDVCGGRKYLMVLDINCTVTEAAFKLRQLAASIERHND